MFDGSGQAEDRAQAYEPDCISGSISRTHFNNVNQMGISLTTISPIASSAFCGPACIRVIALFPVFVSVEILCSFFGGMPFRVRPSPITADAVDKHEAQNGGAGRP